MKMHRTYRTIMWRRGIVSEENRKRGDEEEREHSRYEDPVREEATKAKSSTSASTNSNRHQIRENLQLQIRRFCTKE